MVSCLASSASMLCLTHQLAKRTGLGAVEGLLEYIRSQAGQSYRRSSGESDFQEASMEKWERRDRKRKRKMRVSGAGLRNVWRKIVERARKLKGALL